MDAVTNTRKKYILNLDALQPGDIVLEHGYKPHSVAIMKMTRSHYSHAMLYEGSTIIEATLGGGVFSRVPNRFAVVNENDLKVLRFSGEMDPERMETINLTSRTLIGSSYSISEAFKAGGKKKPKDKKITGQFCSRLVAQCYSAGDIKIVDNINYCSPADIERSPYFSMVENAVKEASEEELAHALAPTPHKKHQESTVQWVKAAKKILKKSGIEAETINDIYSAAASLKNPKVDKLILKEIKGTGHYEFYQDDKSSNPYRYNSQAFSDAVGSNLKYIDEEIHKEISIVKVHTMNLNNAKVNLERYPSCLMAAEVDLYNNILGITLERLNIIISHCKSNKLEPALLNQALSMANSISNI